MTPFELWFSSHIILFLCLPSVILSHYYNLKKLNLPTNTSGPEGLAFDPAGGGPYTGVSDGRVLKYVNRSVGFVDFVVTAPNRSKQVCDGSHSTKGPICGRPLGLEFQYQTGFLYIADAYFGLVAVQPNGGIATQLAISAEDVSFRFLNALDVHQETGIVYFVDTSAKFRRDQFNEALQKKDRTGRLMKYDPKTKEVTVLQKNLGMPIGVAVSKDGNFVIYTEGLFDRAQRFWLTGSKANTSEIFATFPGRPDNISKNPKGEFWIPINSDERSLGQRLRSEDGKVLQTLILSEENPVKRYSEVQQYKGQLYLGSAGLINYVKVISGQYRM